MGCWNFWVMHGIRGIWALPRAPVFKDIRTPLGKLYMEELYLFENFQEKLLSLLGKESWNTAWSEEDYVINICGHQNNFSEVIEVMSLISWVEYSSLGQRWKLSATGIFAFSLSSMESFSE